MFNRKSVILHRERQGAAKLIPMSAQTKKDNYSASWNHATTKVLPH